MTNTTKAHLALITVGLFYAVNYIVAKGIMPTYVGPSGFILIRVLGAAAMFWVVHSIVSKEKIDKKDLPRFIICAVFGVAMNQLFFFNGLNLTTPLNASVIMTSNPILVLIISAVVLKEAITTRKIVGISLGLIGALVLIVLPSLIGLSNLDWKMGDQLGDTFIFINALSYGVYLVLVKPLMRKYEALTVIKWVFTFGLVMVLPFGFEQAMAVKWTTMPTNILFGILYVVVCVTFLAYMMNLYALKTVNPSVVSAYIYLQPVLAGALSISLGMDTLHWTKITAAVMIFVGVYLVSRRTRATLKP